ncbi:AAA family ATPase [Streptomyces sp. PmtG]
MKGKRRPVPAWRLRAVTDAARGTPERPGVALVDREDELAQLDLVFTRVRRDRACHLVTLYGDPGVGKSRLARAFAAEATAAGARVAWAACPPYGSTGSLAPLAEMLAKLAGPEPKDWLTALLGTSGSDEVTATALARLARSGWTGTSFEETCLALQRLATELGRAAPLVVIVDDVQWAHADLLGALDHLADWVQGAAVLVLCLARPELLEEHGHWGSGKLNATALALPPLAPDDCRELLARLSGRAPAADVEAHLAPRGPALAAPADGALDEVIRRAEGNPLFLEQLMEMVGEGADPRDVPLTVRAIVAARLDRLGADERMVLECAAVIGADFAERDLGTLTEPEPEADAEPDAGASAGAPGPAPAARVVRGLVRRRLLEAAEPGPAGEPRWRHVSQLIRDEVYSGMSKLLRARRHERFAAHAERRAPGDHHTIGTHLEKAAHLRAELDPTEPEVSRTAARAARHLGRAGTAALAQGDVSWAVGLLHRALALTEPRRGAARRSGPVRRRRARSAGRAGRGQDRRRGSRRSGGRVGGARPGGPARRGRADRGPRPAPARLPRPGERRVRGAP